MTKSQVLKEFDKLKFEIINNNPIMKKPYPKSIIKRRELLLYAQVHLNNILESKLIKDRVSEDMNTTLYKMMMTFYHGWETIKKY